MLPDKSKNGKRKTKVRKHTLNPIFDETLKYFMPLNSLETRTLWLTVWHSDMFGRNDFLGEVTINLQGIVFDNPQPQWYTLQERVSIRMFIGQKVREKRKSMACISSNSTKEYPYRKPILTPHTPTIPLFNAYIQSSCRT